MGLEDLQKQLEVMAANVGEVVKLAPIIQDLQSQMNDIQAERKSQQQQIAAAQTQEEKDAERKLLLSDIKEIVAASAAAANETIPAAFAKAINHSGQPARRSVPIAAQGASTNVDGTISISAERLELLQKEAELQGMRTAGVDNPRRVQLAAEVGSLKRQIH